MTAAPISETPRKNCDDKGPEAGELPSLRHDPRVVETRILASGLHGAAREGSSADCSNASAINAALKMPRKLG